MTKEEREYANLQNRKDALAERIASGTMAIKNQVNESKAAATAFFEIAGVDGARDVLMSASAVTSANVNHLLASLTPAEAVNVFSVIGALKVGQNPPEVSPKELLLGQLIVLGYQLSALPESPHSVLSSFDLQVQGDGSVVVGDAI